MSAALQTELEAAVDAFKDIQLEIEKSQRSRQQYLQQQHENEMVLKELEMLKDDDKVYKLIGPALIRQEQVEATATVKKRLEYIAAELNRIEERYTSLEEKAVKKQQAIMKMQEDAAVRQGPATTSR